MDTRNVATGTMGNRAGMRVGAAVVLVLTALLGATPGFGAGAVHGPDELLVRFRPGGSRSRLGMLHAAAGTTAVKEFSSVDGLHLVRLAPGASMERAIVRYGSSPDVLYVEPNRPLTLQRAPNDPGFADGELWHLDTRVPIFEDPDVDAPGAWDVTTGSRDVVVAIIDSGVDYTHPDLAANIWRNEADCDADGVDDDGNGFVDDCHGIDPIDGDSDPMDAEMHGTHVAGIIGAVGNNAVGVVGVNWAVALMPCKVFDETGYGSLAAAITCLDYVAMMKDRGVDVVATNNSWSVANYSASLRDAIEAQRQHGILFVAAAGNYASCSGTDPFNCRLDRDNDRKPTWPASFYIPNVISVANSLTYGWLNPGSAYGRRTVHVAAPGTEVLSTTPGNTYEYLTGTSMSAPMAAGVAALLKAQNPARDWRAIKNLILAGSEGDMFPDDGTLIADARLNARGSVTCADKALVSRLRPVPAAVTAVVGRPMELSAVNVRCAAPAGNVTVTVDPGGQAITLRDDGIGFDQAAGDGIYSGQWTPATQGQFTATFPGGDVVNVQVLAGGYTVAAVPFAGRTITGTSITMIPMQAQPLPSPFPLRFAGGSFTTVFVDERGALQFDGGDFCSDLPVFNEPLPSPFHSTLIAPFWDQIMDAATAEVLWEVRGAAPHRELVVEWRNMQRTDFLCDLFDDFVTFQVVFFEGSSDILFNYPDTTVGGDCPDLDAGASATVGIQVAPDVATTVGFNAPVIPDGTSLLWTLGQAPQPAITVTPASADFGTVTVGSAVDVTFVVTNSGTGTLTGLASTAAPFSIVSGGTYALAAGQTQVVTARFRPTSAATFVGNVAFTGGAGASRAVRGVGVASNVAPDLPTAPAQFRTDGTTAVTAGGWTNQTSLVVAVTMHDASPADALTAEVEIEPVGTAFDGTGVSAGSAVVSTGAPVQGAVTLTGLADGKRYHWRVRVRDAAGQASGWVSFGGNAESAADVAVETAVPTGSIAIAGGDASTRTRSVTLALKCSDKPSGCRQMQLSQDGGAFSAPEAFAGNQTWTLAGADGVKTVSVRFIDGAGNVSKTYADTIAFDTTGPVVSAITASPNPVPHGKTTTIRFRVADAVSASCAAEVRILDGGGRLMRKLPKTAKCPAGGAVTSVSWNGKNAGGALVAAGTYTIELVASDVAGNGSAAARGTVVMQ